MPHERHLQRMNEKYVAASLAGDVDWYRTHLADEFVCIESDASLLDKNAFLRLTVRGCSDLEEYQLIDVDVKFYGDVALVRALGSWTKKTGMRGISRYIDVYVRSDDEWKVVSAQITRAQVAQAGADHESG
jgi:ketosteroid isomerase-like protein